MAADLQKKETAAAVMAACSPVVRDISVGITVRARVGDDSNPAPLFVEALQELIARCPDEAEGMFESEGGLDVSWKMLEQQLPSLAGH